MAQDVDYFGGGGRIFANKELLQVHHLPDSDRIIGRDEQLQELGGLLREGIGGGTPEDIIITGKTGTGKSLSAKFMSRELGQRGKDNDVSVGHAYIDCLQDSTETQVVRSIATTLNRDLEDDISIPESGLSTSAYYQRLWRVMNEGFDVCIVILDEADKLDDDSVIMQLSRAQESGKVDTDTKLSIIAISNKLDFGDQFGERTDSSASFWDIQFPAYNAHQIRAILQSRSDAFAEGVLDDEVIPKVAAIAAREHGDARKAIDILRFAGEIAKEKDDETVTVDHVDDAQLREERNRLADLINTAPDHTRFVLLALATLVQQSTDEEPKIPNNDVYESYRRICEREGYEALKERRVRDLLSELEFLNVIEQDRHGRGRGLGSYTSNRLRDDPQLVIDACKVSGGF